MNSLTPKDNNPTKPDRIRMNKEVDYKKKSFGDMDRKEQLLYSLDVNLDIIRHSLDASCRAALSSNEIHEKIDIFDTLEFWVQEGREAALIWFRIHSEASLYPDTGEQAVAERSIQGVHTVYASVNNLTTHEGEKK